MEVIIENMAAARQLQVLLKLNMLMSFLQLTYFLFTFLYYNITYFSNNAAFISIYLWLQPSVINMISNNIISLY